jgi:hypothetical protein
MATTYRLSALSIFLLLLGVLLIGYLLNYTWESFRCGAKEHFATLEGSGVVLTGYSKNNKNVIKLIEDGSVKVYYDPYGKNIIEPKGTTELIIRNRNNTEKTHPFASDTKKMVDLGPGQFTIPDNETGTNIAGKEVAEAIQPDGTQSHAQYSEIYLAGTTVEDQLLEVELSNDVVVDAKTYNLADIYNTEYNPEVNGITTKSQFDSLPLIDQYIDKTNTRYHCYAIVKQDDNYQLPENLPSAATSFIHTEYHASGNPKYAFLHVPIKTSDGMITPATFIHVMSLQDNTDARRMGKHVKTYYFNGNSFEEYVMDTTYLTANGHIDLSKINGDLNTFQENTFDSDMDSLGSGDFAVSAEHKISDEVIKIIAKKKETVGYSGFRALLSFDTNSKPVINKIDMIAGGDHTREESHSESSTTTGLEDKWAEYRRLQGELLGPVTGGYAYHGSYDGSPYSDYLLKTEVVPPVCPSCPASGVCNNCGGNGGSGASSSSELRDSLVKEFGSGIDQFLRDGAGGATTLARDAAKGTYDVAKEVTTGTVDVAKDTAAGTGEFVQSSASGMGEYAKDVGGSAYGAASDVAQGTVGIGREIVGGAYDAAGNVASGVYNAGASVAGGAYNIGAGAVNALGQVIPNYGAPGAGASANASTGGPNMAMGGYTNSYGGGYQNPQTPGQDPYSYFGSVPPRYGGANYMPVTADFSPFRK